MISFWKQKWEILSKPLFGLNIQTDPHSPLHFHTKILGFEVIGSHLHGELNCSSTRIILTLDILKAYQRLKERKNRIYQEVTAGIRDLLDRKLAERRVRLYP